MNEREKAWAISLCQRSKELFQNSGQLYDEIESYFSYQLAKETIVNTATQTTDVIGTIEGDGWTMTLSNEETISQGGEKKEKTVVSNDENIQSKGGSEDLKYLTKRQDGRWQGRKTINGVRVCVYGATQLECREKLAKMGKVRKREPRAKSFVQFSKWWLETYKKGNIAPTTYKGYSTTINAHLNISTPINKVTLQQLQVLLSALPGTRIREEVFKLIRQIMKKAYELDIIKKDISEFLDKGKIKRAEKRALNLEEQRKLLKALEIDDMFSRRVIFYLCTGARPAEIATVKKSELRPGYVKINGTKTKSSVRWVKVSNEIVEMIKGQSKEFFTFNEKRFREHLQKVCQSIGIDYEITVYTLRHTFATNLYILGVPEKDRQAYMGHKEGSKITNDVYTTYSPDVKAQDIYDIYGDWYPKF